MQRIHEEFEYENVEFEMPNTVEKKTLCSETGKLASSDACSKYTEYYAEGTGPTQSCPGHAEVDTTPTTDGTTDGTSAGDTTGNTGGDTSGDTSGETENSSNGETDNTP